MNYIITGASRGIGRFLLEKFVEADVHVLGTYHKTPPADATSQYYVSLDVTDEDAIAAFAQSHVSKMKDIVLLHCAGTNVNGFTHKLSQNDWEKTIETNLTSAFLMSKNILPTMREQNFGRIIFFSSVVPEIGIAGTSAYAASKAGLWGLMKTLSKEGASKNVTCNALNLGYFNVGMISEVPEPVLTKTIQTIPMQKLGDPKNIYNAVQFLAYSDYITGSEISINGGLA
jgi:NAD(P)-dependent dehydrogenase (short-subunit alcohol dehydrogenase family)